MLTQRVSRVGVGSWQRLLLAILMSLGASTAAGAIDLRSVVADYTVAGWSRKDGLGGASILSLAEDRDGFIWLGTDVGLLVFDGTTIARWRGTGSHLLPQSRVLGLISDSDGSIVAALGDEPAVFVRIRNGHAELFADQPGYDKSRVTFLARDGSTVWMGTRRGLRLAVIGSPRRVPGILTG